jgi:hypothetical protein
LEKIDVLVAEGSVAKPPHVKDAQNIVATHQRNAEHHLDALLPQERIRDCRRVDVIQPHWFLRGGDTSGETGAERNPYALANLVLDATRRPGDEHLGIGIEHQHGSRVDVKNLAHPAKQLHQKIIDIKARQLDVGEGLQVLETQRKSVVTHTNGVRHTHQNRMP